jgi:hypothetical protein
MSEMPELTDKVVIVHESGVLTSVSWVEEFLDEEEFASYARAMLNLFAPAVGEFGIMLVRDDEILWSREMEVRRA